MTEAPRKCPICWKPLVHRPGEVPSKFNGRMFCSKGCATAARGARYDSLLRDGKAPAPTPKADPQKPGPKPAPKPKCSGCGKEVATPKSKYCSVLCANRHKPRSGAQLSQTPPEPPTPPKPRMATQRLCQPKPERPTGTHLATIPKKKKELPVDDPERCVYVAKPVWFSDGAAVIAGLVATLPLCSRIVAGWLATVPSDADQYVQPRFTTAETRDLFDQMVDNKTGRREGRAA